ncbi:hypothetical protein IQ06DRAFT_345463 [Phaeosphaeriaceae sp. SRC1lsM3a]|nr:hypothetical protein IQ06DRAFT_345463 [Stagonospora sp. SRC1lsM3a]
MSPFTSVLVAALCIFSYVVEAVPTAKRANLEPKAAALRCGEHGYDGGKPAYIAIENVPMSDCPIACNYFADCHMYATSTDPGYCYIYYTDMADNFNPVASSPYVFYEKACNRTSA